MRIENEHAGNSSVTHILDTHVPKQYINRNNVISTEPYARTYDKLVHVERQNTDVPHTNYDYVAHVNNYNTLLHNNVTDNVCANNIYSTEMCEDDATSTLVLY